jgi:hypothetical protein
MREDELIQWLLAGDPAIRWQVHRDLLGAGRPEVNAERARVAREGWGRRLLDRQAANGRWMATRGPKGAKFRGLYIPKWTSTTYTMLLLARLGLPEDHPQARQGCRALVVANQPTPWAGVWERITIFGYLLWGVVLAIGLLRTQSTTAPGQLGREGTTS